MGSERQDRRDHELRRIDAALVRLAKGDYGYCARCGAPIEMERLDADPAVNFCHDCGEREDEQL